MPPRRRAPRSAMADRPPQPYLPDGTLDPREWRVALTACNAIALALLANEPWFLEARPVEVKGQGVAVEVVVRWVSPEIVEKVPAGIDGYPVHVVVEGEERAGVTLH